MFDGKDGCEREELRMIFKFFVCTIGRLELLLVDEGWEGRDFEELVWDMVML